MVDRILSVLMDTVRRLERRSRRIMMNRFHVMRVIMRSVNARVSAIMSAVQAVLLVGQQISQLVNECWMGCYVEIYVRLNDLLTVLVFGNLHRYERIHGHRAEIYTLSTTGQPMARRVPRDSQGITRVGRDRADTTGLR